MSRWLGWGLGAAALFFAVLALGASPIEAYDDAPQVETGRRSSGYLGVILEDVTGNGRGALIKKVEPDTPAAKAGLKEGDLIGRYDGERVRSAGQLARMVRETPSGRSVPMEVTRDGNSTGFSVTLGERKGGMHIGDLMPDLGDLPMPPDAPESPDAPSFRWEGPSGKGRALWFDRSLEGGPRKLGIRYQEISGQLAKYFRLADEGGILVVSVDEDGPAAKAGMKAGDVILKVNGKQIRDGDALRDEVAQLEANKDATVNVQRDGRPVDLTVKVGEPPAHGAHGPTT